MPRVNRAGPDGDCGCAVGTADEAGRHEGPAPVVVPCACESVAARGEGTEALTLSRWALLIVGIVLAALIGVTVLSYSIGLARLAKSTPAPDAVAAQVTSQSAEPSPQDEATKVPPPDPNSPYAKDIPGCVCHSDDPKLVQEHAEYRMNQCFGCHSEGVPTGAK